METKLEQVLEGDVFIIPNGLVAPSNIYVYEEDNLPYKEVWTKKNEKYRETRDYYLKVSGIKEFSDSAGLVEVWCATPGPDDSNWSCHGIDLLEEPKRENFSSLEEYRAARKNNSFVSHLPSELFSNKVEGDTVEFESKWGTIRLKLSQLKYRYRRFGPFEAVLKQLRMEYLGF